MTRPNEPHLSPSETARRFGVSIKALRLYEQRGLLAPQRSQSGSTGSAWRVYGPDQIARLHQIIALKHLGLSLAQIGEVLAGPDRLETVLALQEGVLTQDSARLARALALVKAARTKLAAGQALSIDDLANLTKETVMTTPLSPEEYAELMRDIGNRHFTPEEIAALQQRKFDQTKVTAQWDVLLRQASEAMRNGTDPADPQIRPLAVQWRALIEQFTGGDPVLLAKLRAVWSDVDKEPRMAATNPVTPELRAYMRQAIDHLPK